MRPIAVLTLLTCISGPAFGECYDSYNLCTSSCSISGANNPALGQACQSGCDVGKTMCESQKLREETAARQREIDAERRRAAAAEAELAKIAAAEAAEAKPDNSAEAKAAAKPVNIGNAGRCRDTMGFLGDMIPRFTNPEIDEVRSALLAESVRTTMRAAKAQGFSGDSAVKSMFEQARELERTARSGAICASQVDAMGTSDEEFLRGLKSFQAPAQCSSIRDACLCAGVVNRISAVQVRAMAAEFECFIRSEGW